MSLITRLAPLLFAPCLAVVGCTPASAPVQPVAVASLPPAASSPPSPPPAVEPDWPSVRKQLRDLFDSDQGDRTKASEAELKAAREGHPMTDAEKKADWKSTEELDATNRQRLASLLDRYGWPPISKVGQRAALGAFLVLQHAPLDMQERYVPMMRRAVEQKEALAGNLALLEDRIRLEEGKGQLYGSQVKVTGGVVTLALPVEDPAHLDERRATVGLEPVCEYLAEFRAQGPISWPSCTGNETAGRVVPASSIH